MFRLVIKNSSGAVIGGREAKTLKEIQQLLVDIVKTYQSAFEVGDTIAIVKN